MTDSKSDRLPIYIDSKDRVSGTNENFEIKLAVEVERITKIDVVSVEIPYTFYINKTSNSTIAFTNGTTSYTASVDPGNYDAITYATTLQTAMNAQMAGFTVTYSVPTYKLTFANTTPFQITLSGTTMATIIGLTADSTLGTSFTTQGTVNLSGPNYILVKSEALTRPKVRRPLYGGDVSDILYKMVVSTGPGTTLIEKNLFPNNPITYGTRQRIQQFDLALLDSDGNVLDLNGQRWSMTLVANIA